MTPENLIRGKALYERIKRTKYWITLLENAKTDISISGHYRKNSDPEVWSVMRKAALSVYHDRLKELEEQFDEL